MINNFNNLWNLSGIARDLISLPGCRGIVCPKTGYWQWRWERERPEFVMMNFTEFHSNWTGITLLPGALGAQVLDLLGPWHNCTGLIKSI